LLQVLTNLVDNALKFTEYGEIALAVRSWEESEKGVLLVFSMYDRGIGIPQEYMDGLLLRDELDLFLEEEQAHASD
jgi:two-component system sensor histidine kinase/response regulator